MIIISLPCICRIKFLDLPFSSMTVPLSPPMRIPLPLQSLPFHHGQAQDPLPFPPLNLLFTNFFQGIHNEWELLIVKRWCQQYPSSPCSLRTLSTDSKHALCNHYPGIWKTGNDIFPTWLINASTVWILNFSFYSILVSCIIFSVLGSLPYIPVATARCVTLVWVPLWPFTCVEI